MGKTLTTDALDLIDRKFWNCNQALAIHVTLITIPSTMPAAFCLTLQVQIDPKAVSLLQRLEKKVSATFIINFPDNVLFLGRWTMGRKFLISLLGPTSFSVTP